MINEDDKQDPMFKGLNMTKVIGQFLIEVLTYFCSFFPKIITSICKPMNLCLDMLCQWFSHCCLHVSIIILYMFTAPPPALDFDLDLDELEENNPNKILNFSNCEDKENTPTVQDDQVVEIETNDVDQIEQQKTSPQTYDTQGNEQ